MIRPEFLHSALDWLRLGYPDGVPTKDYSPVLALLRRQQLTEQEVGYIAARLADQAVDVDGGLPISRDDVEREIAAYTREDPEDADVERVAARLGEHAWPVAQDSSAPVPG